MILTKSVSRSVDEIDDILCDSCGKSCKMLGAFVYIPIVVKWGYGSKYDCEEWTAQICEACTETKLNFIKFMKQEYAVFN